MLTNIVCPMSFEKIDSNSSRLTVFTNAALMIVYLVTLNPILLYIVTIDYGIRAFGYKKYSPIARICGSIIKALHTKTKLIDVAPKTFASRLGFICAVLGTIFIICGMPLASRSIIGFFSILAILDSVFDYCVGCFIYYELVYPFYKKRGLVD